MIRQGENIRVSLVLQKISALSGDQVMDGILVKRVVKYIYITNHTWNQPILKIYEHALESMLEYIGDMRSYVAKLHHYVKIVTSDT